MSMMGRGRPCKVDGNHGEIRAVLRDLGAKVQDLSAVGRGVPDLLVMYRGRVELLEVKDGSKPPSARRLTPDEDRWHKAAHARGVTVHVVTSVDDALRVFGLPTGIRA